MLGAGWEGCAGTPMIVESLERAGVPWSERAAEEEAFLTRPSLLIFSEIDIVDILSMDGVPSRELVDGSLMEVADEAFFAAGIGVFGLAAWEEGTAEPDKLIVSSLGKNR